MSKIYEFKKGNIPLIITVPHGGALVPQNIPNRDFGSYKKDKDTNLVLKSIVEDFKRKNQQPYFVVMYLHRRKIDVNRGSREGAQCNEMLRVYKEYHSIIREFRIEVQKKFNAGLMIDLHGQKAKKGYIEIGYGLSKELLDDLRNSDVDEDLIYKQSSLKFLINNGHHAHDLVFGAKSLGAFLSKNFNVYPSPQHQLLDEIHYNGVYTLQRHVIKRKKENMIGANLELCYEGIRDTKKNREEFAKTFVQSVNRYIKEYL